VKALLVIAALAALAPRAEAKGCHEVSDVVGYHHCTRFGYLWSRESDSPRFTFDIGWYYHRFTALPFTLGDAARLTQPAPNFYTASHGVQVRFLGGIGHVLYTGLELDAGSIDVLPQPIGLQPQQGMSISPNAVLGAHLFERFRLAVSAELVGGVRYADFFVCDPPNATKCMGPDSSEWRRQLEARGRIDVYPHPHFSIGFAYGHSLLDSTDSMWSISLGIHGRTMNGSY
jgi:hypothetical protein